MCMWLFVWIFDGCKRESKTTDLDATWSSQTMKGWSILNHDLFPFRSSVLSLESVSRKQQPDCLMQATKSGITLPKIGFLVTGGRFRSKVLELWFTDGWQSTKHQSVNGNCSALNQKPSYRYVLTDLDRRHHFLLNFFSYKFCNYIYWMTVLLNINISTFCLFHVTSYLSSILKQQWGIKWAVCFF